MTFSNSLKNILLLVFLCIFYNAHSQNSEFCNHYPAGCSSVTEFYSENKKELVRIIENDFEFEHLFLFAIVAPEIAKYSSLQDKLETSALDMFYVNLGAEYSNFSIANFQIKPSFVQELEKKVTNSESLKTKFLFITKYTETTLTEIRKERLLRMKTLEWQIKYLCCFYAFVEEKFKHKTFQNISEKLVFFATAYNLGLNATSADIQKHKNIRNFPDLPFHKNFNYAEVAKYFYFKI